MNAPAQAQVFSRSPGLRRILVPGLRKEGAILVASLAILLLAVSCIEVLLPVPERYHATIQTASRREAQRAAQVGVERAVADLNTAGSEFSSFPWDAAGWTQRDGSAVVPASAASLSRGADPEKAKGELDARGVRPLLLKNCDIPPVIGLAAKADVELSVVYPDPEPDHSGNVSFLIRSAGSSVLSGPRWARVDRLDLALRRISIGNMRQTLAAHQRVGFLENWTTPLATRIGEALVRPSQISALGLAACREVILGSSSGWNIDSYDSRDPAKSAANPAFPGVIGHGIYPGEGSPKVQSHCVVGTNGQFVDANGAIIKGSVGTHSGIVLNSQNVTGTIRGNFSRDLPPPIRPHVSAFEKTPDFQNGAPFPSGGNAENPYCYRISGDLGSFSVAPPPPGVARGYVTIFVDGALKLGTHPQAFITIPPGVICKLYVRDNIDFGDGLVNTTPSSSRMAAQLIINGERTLDSKGLAVAKTVVATGSASVAAVLNAPDYDVSVGGMAEWYGSVIARKYTVIGKGNGGFHYDEALDAFGKIEEFRIVSYDELSLQR